MISYPTSSGKGGGTSHHPQSSGYPPLNDGWLLSLSRPCLGNVNIQEDGPLVLLTYIFSSLSNISAMSVSLSYQTCSRGRLTPQGDTPALLLPPCGGAGSGSPAPLLPPSRPLLPWA